MITTEPFTYDSSEHLQRPEGEKSRRPPVPRSLITGQRMTKIENSELGR